MIKEKKKKKISMPDSRLLTPLTYVVVGKLLSTFDVEGFMQKKCDRGGS